MGIYMIGYAFLSPRVAFCHVRDTFGTLIRLQNLLVLLFLHNLQEIIRWPDFAIGTATSRRKKLNYKSCRQV